MRQHRVLDAHHVAVAAERGQPVPQEVGEPLLGLGVAGRVRAGPSRPTNRTPSRSHRSRSARTSASMSSSTIGGGAGTSRRRPVAAASARPVGPGPVSTPCRRLRVPVEVDHPQRPPPGPVRPVGEVGPVGDEAAGRQHGQLRDGPDEVAASPGCSGGRPPPARRPTPGPPGTSRHAAAAPGRPVRRRGGAGRTEDQVRLLPVQPPTPEQLADLDQQHRLVGRRPGSAARVDRRATTGGETCRRLCPLIGSPRVAGPHRWGDPRRVGAPVGSSARTSPAVAPAARQPGPERDAPWRHAITPYAGAGARGAGSAGGARRGRRRPPRRAAAVRDAPAPSRRRHDGWPVAVTAYPAVAGDVREVPLVVHRHLSPAPTAATAAKIR